MVLNWNYLKKKEIANMKSLKKIFKYIKSFFQSDHNWKKENCPTLYNYIMILDDKEKKKVFDKILENKLKE